MMIKSHLSAYLLYPARLITFIIASNLIYVQVCAQKSISPKKINTQNARDIARKALEAQGILDLQRKHFDYIFDSYRNYYIAKVDTNFWRQIKEYEVPYKIIEDSLIDHTLKYYSIEELQEITQFFNSKIGRKYIENGLKISEELQGITKYFDQKIKERVDINFNAEIKNYYNIIRNKEGE
ncbi:MAG: DUF2059 domain-containing protein [Chitinophagales bacterium]|jgi:hypothetical protein|nr:DUF2059 domain-containing protein [Chitinophagales bacterium]